MDCRFKKSYIKNFLIILQILFISSCVGTIKDANPKSSNVLNSGSTAPAVSFDGLTKAVAIANDKVELFFKPASSSAEIIYEIYVNNTTIPIKVNGKTLKTDASGNYSVTITNLTTNTTYSFNMMATPAGFDSSTKLDATKSLTATTFNNETADFYGITSATVAVGANGKNTINLKWNPATIKGTSLNVKDSDPVQYEITYISQLGGISNINNSKYTGGDRKVIITPSTLSDPPALNDSSSYSVSGLTSGVTYYFQVRAIHKGYIKYSTDPYYRRELNTKSLKATTLTDVGVFDFNTSEVLLSHPLGEIGLTSLDVSWNPASGSFDHYLICSKKVASQNGTAPTDDKLTETVLDGILNDLTYCVQSNSIEDTTYRIKNLESYSYYQVKVIACKTSACTSANRITSAVMQSRVVANLVQFNGIQSFDNPSDASKLNQIQVNFEAPVTTSGYLNKMKLYCYQTSTDGTPYSLPTDGSISSGTGKSNCNGISVDTTFPTTTAGFSSFTKFNLSFNSGITGDKTYCFSLSPVIESSYLTQEDTSTLSIKCFTPKIATPTIVQFPGKNTSCSSTTGTDLKITWPIPTGGLYTNFVIFYKEKSSGSDFFSFDDAIAAYESNNTTSAYKWLDAIDPALVNYNILNLTPGNTFSIGVLTYLTSGTKKYYSQYNLNVDDCYLPLPTPTFEEWVDIFAIGPKEDGLTPPGSTGTRRYIAETLDDDGIPVEIKLQSDDRSVDTSNALGALRQGNQYLDGVYGAKDANSNYPLYQYSNSGIIKIAWKDVSFFSGTKYLNDYITALEKTPSVKSSRKYGYKIYRSDDNQLTWVDLTTYNTKNKFQSSYNSGLIHPKTYSWKKRNNATSNTEQIAFFTDYSVKFSGVNGEVDRARTYWYKIIPIFNGKELTYNSSTNPTHQTIRVTLPPRNMALVHRLMANRTICLEMDKDLNKKSNEYYSCNYNGLGSSGLTTPSTIGKTVYDLGGDLLIDRFELSCPFTRGDISATNSDSTFSGSKQTFTGYSTNGNKYKGCFNVAAAGSLESIDGSYLPSANYEYKQVVPGDCFGIDPGIKSTTRASACADPARINPKTFTYPGAGNNDYSSYCTDPSMLGYNITNLADPNAKANTDSNLYPTQSEFAGIYFARSRYGYYDETLYNYPAANNETLVRDTTVGVRAGVSNCSVNLAYINSTGTYKARWIGISFLFDKLKRSSQTSTLSLYDKSISEILSNSDLYDSTNVKAPTADLTNSSRYSSTTKLARIATSNSAKLPPISGLNQLDYNKICSTYKVQVGIETSANGFVSFESAKSKRLVTKKEFIASAAWPQHYDSTNINKLELGTYTDGTYYNGCNGPSRIQNNSSAPVSGKSYFVKGDLISPNFPYADYTHTALMTGSSRLDSNNRNLSSDKCVSRFGIQDLVGNLAEVAADEIFCDFTQDKMFIGKPDNILESSAYNNASEFYDPTSVTPWVLKTPLSGSCSVVEKGAYHPGNYASGGTINPITSYLGYNSNVISNLKRFFQEAILQTRNGDGTFLDFGQSNIGAKLDATNSLSLTTASNASDYYSIPLGIPLACKGGCDTNASDNTYATADKIATAKGYDSTNNPLSIQLLDFPVNNGTILNNGISDNGLVDSYSTTTPDDPAINYINGVDLGSNSADPNDNFSLYATLIPGSGTPSILYRSSYTISRSTTSLKFFNGGGINLQPSRYSFRLTGGYDNDERVVDQDHGARCSIMINQE